MPVGNFQTSTPVPGVPGLDPGPLALFRSSLMKLTIRLGRATNTNAFLLFSAVNPTFGVVDAYQHMAPMIDTAVFMQWLYQQCHHRGCRFVQDGIQGLLKDQAEELKIKYKAQLIVNCSGLSARELAGDEDVYPSRGEIGSFIIVFTT